MAVCSTRQGRLPHVLLGTAYRTELFLVSLMPYSSQCEWCTTATGMLQVELAPMVLEQQHYFNNVEGPQ